MLMLWIVLSFSACYICYHLGYYQGNNCDCEYEKKDELILGKYFKHESKLGIYRVFKVDHDTIYLEKLGYFSEPIQYDRELFDKHWREVV